MISNGQLLITNLNGELLKTIPVKGQGDFQVRIEAGTLKAGIYLYTLIIEGQEIASRKMILTE